MGYQCSLRDHPRSRGVYDVEIIRGSQSWGSSPLARGLRRRRGDSRRCVWIIPARAGFTPAGFWTVIGGTDHPRSRGVYEGGRNPKMYFYGSSPLARGLRADVLTTSRVNRIIPARAGFTWGERAGIGPCSDHPRSRGVYLGPIQRRFAFVGSSPLARGLHSVFCVSFEFVRIIPARAGFTYGPGRPYEGRGDHPRSRGVYVGSAAALARAAGSSPLARGLRRLLLQVTVQPGIIPARAGFTRSGTCTRLQDTDHPRSRGVYAATPRMAARIVGSSPLARGLPLFRAPECGAPGIIPARAGFTSSEI